MCSLARTHWRMQVEVSLKVVSLDVSTPLAVALDGGVTVLPTSMVVDLLPEVRCLIPGHRHVVTHRRARTWHPEGTCATDGIRATHRKHDCCIDGWRRSSRCGVLMAAMTSWSTS
jgi:hypothetical protein